MPGPLIFPPCRICTGIATGIHYGVNTCEACKAFFRRAVKEKNKYQCLKEENCVITDRRRGNCSFCRLQKCQEEGMSFSAARHGRYTIALRTKTIMEVKRLEGKPTITSSDMSSESTASQSSKRSSTSSSLQEKLKTGKRNLTSRKSLRLQSRSPTEAASDAVSSFPLLEDSEEEFKLHDIINTLVEAQGSIYPHLILKFDKEYIEKRQREFLEYKKMKEKIFGISSMVSVDEFMSVYRATGLDIDNRLAQMATVAGHMQRGIVRYITYAKAITGFNELSNDDKLALIKAARFEYWLLGHYLHFCPDLGIVVGGELQFTREEMTNHWESASIVTELEKFSVSLQKLDLRYEEVAILRAIVILFRDRCQLQDPEKVEEIQWQMIKCLKILISEHHPGEEHRFALYMDKLVQMRSLTEINNSSNKMLKAFRMDILKDYPLIYECIYK